MEIIISGLNQAKENVLAVEEKVKEILKSNIKKEN